MKDLFNESLEGIFQKDYTKYARLERDGNIRFQKLDNIAWYFEEDKQGDWYWLTDDRIKLKKSIIKTSELKKIKETNKMLGKRYSIYTNDIIFSHNYWLKKKIPDSNIWYLDIEAIDINNKIFPDVFNPTIPVTHIQILDKKTNIIFMLMLKDISQEDKLDIEEQYTQKIKWIICKDELQLFDYFAKLIDKMKPTIITGWNAETFDFPYITKRAEKLGFNIKRFSPLNKIEEKEIERFGKKNLTVNWLGIYLIDMLDAFKKFTYKDHKSYSLEYITKAVLKEGDGKISYGKYKSIHLFYEHNYKEFCNYAVKDVDVLSKLDEKIGLMNLVITMATEMGCNYDTVFGTVKPWTIFVRHLAIERQNVLPLEKEFEDNRPITGGFVKDPNVGLFQWVASYDYNSFYPSAQVTMNLSPDTYVSEIDLDEEGISILRTVNENEDNLTDELFDRIEKYCKKHNYSFGGLGFFRRDKQGLLPEEVEKIYYGRKSEKQKMLLAEAVKLSDDGIDVTEFINKIENNEITWDNVYDIKVKESPLLDKYIIQKDSIQMAKKIEINSEFGYLDNQYNVINNRNISGSITFISRTLIKRTNKKLNEFFNKIISTKDKDYVQYTDTDSGYIKLDNIVDRMLKDKDYNDLSIEEKTEFVKKIVKFINTHLQPLIDETVEYIQTKFNAYKKGFMGAKVEKIGYSGIWLAKKRYAILTLWDEGKFMIEKPKLKVTGIETVRSSTPDFCIEKLGEGLNIIMTKTEEDLQQFIKKTKMEFYEECDKIPQRVGEVVRVNNLEYEKDDKGWYRINENGKRIGAPMNSKAGIAYNEILSNSEVKEFYQPIEPGMKSYLIKLKRNNPHQTEVIAFLDDEFLKDLGIIKYIDKEGMWQKAFISPIETIANALNYTLEKKSDISDWF